MVAEQALGFLGRVIYPGYLLPIHLDDESTFLPRDSEQPRFALHLVRRGTRQLVLEERLLTVTAPAVLLLDTARPTVVRDLDAHVSTLYFDPAVVNGEFNPQNLVEDRFEGTTNQDRYLLTPFLGEFGRVRALTPSLLESVDRGFGKISREGQQQRDDQWPCRTRSYLIELLFQVRLDEQTRPADILGDNPADQAFARALAEVRTRFAEPLSVGELAARAGTNRTSLNAEFRRRTGYSVHSYVIALRLELAASLLRDTDLAVAQITPRVGYEDHSHFGRLFRRAFGVTPARYRELSRTPDALSIRTIELSSAPW